MVYSSRVLALVLALCIFNCARNSKNETPQHASTVALFTTDTCRFCDSRPFLIESISHNVQVSRTFDYPVALVYHQRSDIIQKWTTSESRSPVDTLLKQLKLKNYGQVHSIQEQQSYFNEIVEPELFKEHITILDTISRSQFVSFKATDKSYFVDLKLYKDIDGIIMFKPGKSPIFWTMDKVADHCSGYDGIVKWYYGCLEQ